MKLSAIRPRPSRAASGPLARLNRAACYAVQPLESRFMLSGSDPAGAAPIDLTREAVMFASDRDNQIGESGNVIGLFQPAVNTEIGYRKDVDFFSFVPRANQRLGFDVDNRLGSSLDSYIRIFDASGRQLAANDDAPAPGENTGREAYATYTFTESARYFVAISAYANSNYDPFTGEGPRFGNSTGSYSLSVISGPFVTAAVSTAGTLIVNGTNAADRIVFRLNPSDPSRLDIDDLANGAGTDITVPLASFSKLRVFGAGGNDQITFDDANGAVSARKPIDINGGAGDDTIVAGTSGLGLAGVPRLNALLAQFQGSLLGDLTGLTVDSNDAVAGQAAELLEQARAGLLGSQAGLRVLAGAIGDAGNEGSQTSKDSIATPGSTADRLGRDIFDNRRGILNKLLGTNKSRIGDQESVVGEIDPVARVQAYGDVLLNRSGSESGSELDQSGSGLVGKAEGEFTGQADGLIDAANARLSSGADASDAAAARLADALQRLFPDLVDFIEGAAAVSTRVPGAGTGPFTMTFTGGPGTNIIVGTNGNDRITDTGGVNLLIGRGGNDHITGGSGIDFIFGGGGNDTVEGGGGVDFLFGNGGDDLMTGGAGALKSIGTTNITLGNFMSGGPGADEMTGGNNLDVMLGGADDDLLRGGDAFDLMFGGAGGDILEGGDGQNINITLPHAVITLRVGNLMFGSGGDDQLKGGDGLDIMFGGADNDTVDGGDQVDLIFGNDGNDILRGGKGGVPVLIDGAQTFPPIGDIIFGNRGNDTIRGGPSLDILFGNQGNDDMDGGDSPILQSALNINLMFGNDGDDRMDGGEDVDLMFGNAGNDTMSGDDGDLDVMFGNAGDDTMRGRGSNGNALFGDGVNVMFGNSDNDTLSGEGKLNVLFGNSGNDVIKASMGIDVMFGNSGDDTLDARGAGGVVPDVMFGNTGIDKLFGGTANSVMFGGEGIDVFEGGDAPVEVIFGGAGNDVIAGRGGTNVLLGGAGDDYLGGGGGLSVMIGNDGEDEMIGGPGFNVMFGGPLDDFMQNGEVMFGGSGNDTLEGDDRSSLLVGNEGLDTMRGRGGSDLMFGGPDGDRMEGGIGSDLMFGNSDDDELFGGGDEDFMFGNHGNDKLRGGTQADVGFGGFGADDVDGEDGLDFFVH